MQNNVVLFNRAAGEQLPAHTGKTNKAGYSTTGYLAKKAYGERFDLKGAALGRAHLQYRIDLGMAGNVNVSTMLTRGEILLQKVTTTKDGFKASFVKAAALGAAPQQKPEEVAGQLTTEQLLAIIEARKPAAPAAAVA